MVNPFASHLSPCRALQQKEQVAGPDISLAEFSLVTAVVCKFIRFLLCITFDPRFYNLFFFIIMYHIYYSLSVSCFLILVFLLLSIFLLFFVLMILLSFAVLFSVL